MRSIIIVEAGIAAVLSFLLSSCSPNVKAGTNDGDPPPVQVVHRQGENVVTVGHPERFELVAADRHSSSPELNVTGVISADVSRNVPVISIASGRILEIDARLGDVVTKGQLLMRVQSGDIAEAFALERLAHRLLRKQQQLALVPAPVEWVLAEGRPHRISFET